MIFNLFSSGARDSYCLYSKKDVSEFQQFSLFCRLFPFMKTVLPFLMMLVSLASPAQEPVVIIDGSMAGLREYRIVIPAAATVIETKAAREL